MGDMVYLDTVKNNRKLINNSIKKENLQNNLRLLDLYTAILDSVKSEIKKVR